MTSEDLLATARVARQNSRTPPLGSNGAENGGYRYRSDFGGELGDRLNDQFRDAQMIPSQQGGGASNATAVERMGNCVHVAGDTVSAPLADGMPSSLAGGASVDTPAPASPSSSVTDDDEEDRNWEPFDMLLQLQPRWYCTNCTRRNYEEASNCLGCAEHRSSGILDQGFLAAPYLPAEFLYTQERPTSNGAISRENEHCNPNGALTAATSLPRKCTAIGYDERMLLHEELRLHSSPHPERPDRLRAILAGLSAAGLFPGRCIASPAREISREELELVHSKALLDHVERTSSEEMSHFTPDTYANKHSSLAARLAAGTCADMATSIVAGEVQNGFALVRPPGHHAEGATCMGFCLHNNSAVAARIAQKAGARKILILDWDVHHGNGTQEIFEKDPTVLFISLHRHEHGNFYPGTGSAGEVGSGPGVGFSVNIPWSQGGIGDEDYISAFHHVVLPIARQFRPDFTIISAGFDAARGDPLGGCKVSPTGYAEMTRLLSPLSEGKLLVILEGGYNLRSISASAAAVVKVLLGESHGPVLDDVKPTRVGAEALLEAIAVHSKYWSELHSSPALERAAEGKSGTEKKVPTVSSLHRTYSLEL